MASEITRSRSNIRNERVELLVHYALGSINPKRYRVDRRFPVGPSGFCTEFDHVVRDSFEKLTLLGQTTCYKERGVGGGEPNKTYEMRETMMEYLLVHVNLLFEESDLDIDATRFFHIIVGDPAYSYSYFHKIRSKCYDLNIVLHPPEGVGKLYRSLEEILPRKFLHNQSLALDVLQDNVMSKKRSTLNNIVSTIKKRFIRYLDTGYPRSLLGQVQAKAICDLAKEKNVDAIQTSENLLTGKGIKELYLKAAKGRLDACGDDIRRVVECIFQQRPFLPEAKTALESDWKQYLDSLLRGESIEETRKPLPNAILDLWNLEDRGKRELIRRILVKLPGVITGEGTAYPQDIPVKGVREHNLYKSIFDNSITSELVKYLMARLKSAGVTSVNDLVQKMKSHGRVIVKHGFDYDVANGTVIRPVRHYVVQALEAEGYKVRKQKDALGTTIKGYYGELFDVVRRPFTSIEIICTGQGAPIALLKAKYFRPPEFDRRVKEEGFISFTSSFHVCKQENELMLKRQYKELPHVMFVDTAPDWTPEPESIKYLVRMGWNVFFRVSDLIGFLKKRVSLVN